LIRYLITDGTAARDMRRWTEYIAAWLQRGVDVVQIREREANARELADLTRQIMSLPNPHGTKVLVNDRADVAMACGADGVHLRAGSVATEEYANQRLMVSVSCHSAEEVDLIRGAQFILLAPVFTPLSKADERNTLGLDGLRSIAAMTKIPVLALGGVTASNEVLCVGAGAAGVAGISLFNRP
jgi:thiamine-phosphate pyrophosphorylase